MWPREGQFASGFLAFQRINDKNIKKSRNPFGLSEELTEYGVMSCLGRNLGKFQNSFGRDHVIIHAGGEADTWKFPNEVLV